MPLIRKIRDTATIASPDLLAITEMFKSGTADERWVAARAAYDIADSAKVLGEALARERDARVREAIFTSLARISTTECVELVLPFLRSDEAYLRSGALDALRAMKVVVAPYLQHLLADRDSDVRLLACELARSVPADEATRRLCALLDSEHEPNVCASAIEVLAEIGGAEALPVLARCEERFRATPFLAFSIKLVADRIRSQSPPLSV